MSCNWPGSKDTWLCEKSHGLLHGCHPAQLKPAPLIIHTYSCHHLLYFLIIFHFIHVFRKIWILKLFPLFIWQTLTIVFNFSSFPFVLRCKLQWFSVVEWSLHSWSTLVIITRNIRHQVNLCVFSGIYQLHYISSFRHSVLGFVSKLIQSSKLYNK